MTSKSVQSAHNKYGSLNSHEAEVFLSYEAVVDRLEDATKQLPGASVLHREGLAILLVEHLFGDTPIATAAGG